MTDIATLGIAIDGSQLIRARDEMGRFVKSSGDVERAAVGMGRGTSGAWTRMAGDAERSSGRIRRAFASVSAQMGAFSRSMPGMSVGGAAAGIFGGILSARGAQQLIDSSVKIQNALKIAGHEGEELASTYDRLFETAQRNGAPVEALVTLYSRMTTAQKELNASSEELFRFTDVVAMSLRASGQSAEESSGALLQLSQVLGGGVVQAEEYNSLLDGARPLLQAVAAGIKEAGGSVAQLTRLVKDGQVSSEAFFRGGQAGAQVLEDQLAGAETTISSAFVRLQNVLTDTAGKMNEGSDASERMSDALNTLSDYIAETDFTPIINNTFDFIGALVETIGKVKELARELGDLTGASGFGDMVRGRKEQDAIQSRIDSAFETTRGDGSSRDRPGTVVDIGGGEITPVSLDMYPVERKAGSGTGRRAGRSGKSEGEKHLESYQREIEQARERTAALVAEREAQASINPLIEDFGYAIARASTAQDLLTAAKKAGTAAGTELDSVQQLLSGDFSDLSAQAREQAQAMLTVASGYADAKSSADELTEAQNRVRDAAGDSLMFQKDLSRGMIDGFTQGKKAADILSDALQKVSDRFLDIALNAAFEPKGAGGGGGLGGIFKAIGGLFTGGLGGGGGTDAWAGLRTVTAASGGYIVGPGTGTSDSIPARLSNGEYVINAKAAGEHRDLLDMINGGLMAKFAEGGWATAPSGEAGAEMVLRINNEDPR